MNARKIILTFFIACGIVLPLFNPIALRAQARTVPNVDSFIEETVQYYFTEWIRKFSGTEHLLRRDSINAQIKTNYTSFKIRLASEQEIFSIIGKKKGRRGWYDKTSVKWFGNDTCDVNIFGASVRVKNRIFLIRNMHVYISIPCGGGDGYIPMGRFIYDAQSAK